MSEVHVDPSVTAPPSGFPVYTDPGEFREKFFRPRAEALRGSKRRIPLSEVIGTTIVEPFFKQTRDELVAQRQQDKVTTVPIWWLLLTVTGLIHTVWAAFFQVVGMSIEAVGREVSNWKQVMLTGEAAPSIAVIWLRGATPSDDLFLLRAKSIAGALGYRLRFESASARDAFLQSKISQHTGNPFGFAQDETIEIPDATAEGGTRKETAYYVVTDVVVPSTRGATNSTWAKWETFDTSSSIINDTTPDEGSGASASRLLMAPRARSTARASMASAIAYRAITIAASGHWLISTAPVTAMVISALMFSRPRNSAVSPFL